MVVPGSGWSGPRIAVLVGGAVVAVAPFFAWFHVVLLGDLTLFQASRTPVLPCLLVALGGAGVATACFTKRAEAGGTLAVIAGGLAGGLSLLLFVAVGSAVSKSDGLAGAGIGPFVSGLGAVVLFFGGVVTLTQRQPSLQTVPPGWFRDPSGRAELRYWNGMQWTAHVSTAGRTWNDTPRAAVPSASAVRWDGQVWRAPDGTWWDGTSWRTPHGSQPT